MTRRPWTNAERAELIRRYPNELTSATAADIAAFEAQERERLAAEQQPTTSRRRAQSSMPLE